MEKETSQRRRERRVSSKETNMKTKKEMETKDLSMPLPVAKLGGEFRTIQTLAKASQQEIQEWKRDTSKFAVTVESLRKLLGADCEIENQAKLITHQQEGRRRVD